MLLVFLVIMLLLIFTGHGADIVAVSLEVDIAAICWP
jgi:hypothetical protein